MLRFVYAFALLSSLFTLHHHVHTIHADLDLAFIGRHINARRQLRRMV